MKIKTKKILFLLGIFLMMPSFAKALDTLPPIVSGLLPSGTFAYGTTQVTLQATTNEAATCKYGPTNEGYSNLPFTFSSTGGTTHTQTVSGFKSGNSYLYYVHCRDISGNYENATNLIQFSVNDNSTSLPLSSIIFLDNFDNCSVNCEASTAKSPDGWSYWSGFYSATHDNVMHYSGEVSFPGRGNGGKSLKTWRHSTDWGGFAGALNYRFPSGLREINMRYYMKLPIDLDLSRCTDSNFLKIWRINTTTASPNHEIYLNINQQGGTARETGKLQMVTAASTPWKDLLSNADLKGIWDGNWHALEFHIDMENGLVDFWVDGVKKYSGSDWVFGDGSFVSLGHFSLGNHAEYGDPVNGCKWQYSWQAMEIDDVMIAKSYIGPLSGGVSDTNPPAVPSGLRVE